MIEPVRLLVVLVYNMREENGKSVHGLISLFVLSQNIADSFTIDQVFPIERVCLRVQGRYSRNCVL